MIVAVQGTKTFKDYAVFMRGMGNALKSMEDDDKTITVFSAGPVNINEFCMEFLNVSEQGLRARGIKSKLVKVPPSWIEKNIHSINQFAFFCNAKEQYSDLVKLGDDKDVDVRVYRY